MFYTRTRSRVSPLGRSSSSVEGASVGPNLAEPLTVWKNSTTTGGRV